MLRDTVLAAQEARTNARSRRLSRRKTEDEVADVDVVDAAADDTVVAFEAVVIGVAVVVVEVVVAALEAAVSAVPWQR